eukprot:scaffold712_cov69-Cyclotella_meneghiniana.AAC.4
MMAAVFLVCPFTFGCIESRDMNENNVHLSVFVMSIDSPLISIIKNLPLATMYIVSARHNCDAVLCALA